MIESVRTGKCSTNDGIVKDPKEIGGYPRYAFLPTEVPKDSDSDGMPDTWESTHGLNPNESSDGAGDQDKDGYTNVEEFLNGTDPREHIDYRNLGNNIDTISG